MERTLCALDFDNTLCVTNCKVGVRYADGTTGALNSHDYAQYEKQLGDTFDYSQFVDVIEPQPIQKYWAILRSALKSPNTDVVILTARENTSGIRAYLQSVGVLVPIIGNAASPQEKAEHIEHLIRSNGYTNVCFFDDSENNETAVQSILRKNSDIQGVFIHTHLVPKHHYMPLIEGT